jgi:hypothetical protein
MELLLSPVQTVKDVGAYLNSEFYFHNNINIIRSHCITLPDLVQSTTFNMSSFELYSYYTLC